MKTYFRITAYSSNENISAIVDSYGMFEKLWQFSAYLVENHFSICAVSKEGAFDDGNIPRATPDDGHLILRACHKGKPVIQDNRIEVNGRFYFKK